MDPPNSRIPFLIRFWKHGFLFLLHATIVAFTIVFILIFVDGRPFHSEHHFDIPWSHPVSIPGFTYLVQSEVTMIVSLLASTARTVSSLWVGLIDLRCTILVLERGGITLQGLKTMSDGLIPIPGIRHFRWKTDFIILIMVHVVLFGSSFLSPVLTGSITWNPAKTYFAWNSTLPQISHANTTGRRVPPTFAMAQRWLLNNFIVDYLHLWGDVDLDSTSAMRREVPLFPTTFPPIGSKVDNVLIPYIAIDSFEWIRDPSFTLTPQQILSLITLPTDAPPEMDSERWGLIPDGQWGQYNSTLPAPHSVSESRIFVTSYRFQRSCLQLRRNNSHLDLDHYSPDCFAFANVTYRAGAAHCGQCRVHALGRVKDYGDFKNLELIDDSITAVALAIAPYMAMSIQRKVPSNRALGFSMSIEKKESIELLSRSYQLAWDKIHPYGDNPFERNAVEVAVDATVASVTILGVAFWSCYHTMLLILGVLFRRLSMCGDKKWIENLPLTALLVNPTSLQCDMGKSFPVTYKIGRDVENQEYIIITHSGRSRADLEHGSDSTTRGPQDSNHEPELPEDVPLLDLNLQLPITPNTAAGDGGGIPGGEFGSCREATGTEIGLEIWESCMERTQGEVASDGKVVNCQIVKGA